MSDTPDTPEPFEFDPEIDQDWDADEHGPMADYATSDDEVDLGDPEEETE